MRPKGILLDYGGTLVEEVEFDLRAGNELLLARATYRPCDVKIEQVLERANRVSKEVAGRRDQFHIETPWPALTRLIHDFLGVRFDDPMPELEMAFWRAAVKTAPIPGAREALEEFHRCGLPTAVLSNCAFCQDVIHYELEKHGLAEHLSFVMVSAEYAVRKPDVLLFETAAVRLGIEPEDIWFVGDRLDTDVVGAEAAGMKPIWLRRTKGEQSNSAHLTVAWAEVMYHFHQACLGIAG